MRTIGIVGLAMLCAGWTAPAVAQKTGPAAKAPEPARTLIGLFGGFNSSTISGSDFTGSTSTSGFMAGGLLERELSSGLFVRVGAKYAARGAEASAAGITLRIKPSYVEIPAVVGFRPGSGAQIRPYAYAGGQLAVRVGCNIEGESGGTSATLKCDDPQLGMRPASTDFGMLGGAGLAIGSGRGSIVIDARYLVGLQNVFKDFQGKNRGFTVGLGFLFPLGG